MGEGTYAVVYEGKESKTGKRVAIKKIKMTTHGAGLDISAIRELKSLSELHHPNVASVSSTSSNMFYTVVVRCVCSRKEFEFGFGFL